MIDQDKLFNYTTLMTRETKIYSFGGTTISPTGIGVDFLKIAAPTTILGLVIGILIISITGKNYYDPFGGNFNIYFVIATLGGGFGIGWGLWNIRVQSYRLFEYLYAYIKPKYYYTNTKARAARQKYKNYKIDSLFKGYL